MFLEYENKIFFNFETIQLIMVNILCTILCTEKNDIKLSPVHKELIDYYKETFHFFFGLMIVQIFIDYYLSFRVNLKKLSSLLK